MDMNSEEIVFSFARLMKEKKGSEAFCQALLLRFKSDKDRLILINYLEKHDEITPSQMEYDLISLMEEYDMHPEGR